MKFLKDWLTLCSFCLVRLSKLSKMPPVSSSPFCSSDLVEKDNEERD